MRTRLKILWLCVVVLIVAMGSTLAANPPTTGTASWYGEEHRGKLMANGKRFDPDKLTAASWFYPLGTRIRVTFHAPARLAHTVVVTITDRGPARELVRNGRIIDLAHAAFKEIAEPSQGLTRVTLAVSD